MTGEVSRALNRFQALQFRPKQNIEHSTLLHSRHYAGFGVPAAPSSAVARRSFEAAQ
jgi:hypothetical protein